MQKSSIYNDLTIISVIENDRGTLDLMIRSVLRFTSFVPRFILCCNNPSEYTNIFIKYKGHSNVSVIKNAPKLSGGSNKHGSALGYAFSSVNTKYTAIIESDCIVTSNEWSSVGDFDILVAKKAKDLYHVCFLVFKTDLLRGIDFRPGNDKNRSNRSYKIEEDVGWRIKDYIGGKKVGLIDFVDCKSGKGKYFDSTFQSDEFLMEGKTICAHFGRGSNLSGKAIRKGFETPTKQLNKWIEIANKIIKEERK